MVARVVEPCTVSIAALVGGEHDAPGVRFAIKTGLQYVARVEMTAEAYGRALLGQAEVPANLITTKEPT